MKIDLCGRKIMISAGASGIGWALAKTFHEHGALVSICDISQQALDAVKDKYPDIQIFKADVSNASEVQAWFKSAQSGLGGLDVLVNNAGIAGPTAVISDISLEQWDQVMAVNVRSQFLCLKNAIPILKQSKNGAIINLSSVAGRLGFPLRTPYATSKWAIIGLTQSLALELGNDNITVNAILPGIVDNERARVVTKTKAEAKKLTVEEMEKEILANVALHRKVPEADVAKTALFLLTDAGRSFTGQSFNVCAGIQTLL